MHVNCTSAVAKTGQTALFQASYNFNIKIIIPLDESQCLSYLEKKEEKNISK